MYCTSVRFGALAASTTFTVGFGYGTAALDTPGQATGPSGDVLYTNTSTTIGTVAFNLAFTSLAGYENRALAYTLVFPAGSYPYAFLNGDGANVAITLTCFEIAN
jgi:hypothetical protein